MVVQVKQAAFAQTPRFDVIRRVLVVDDSRAQLTLLSSILRKWGVDALTAESGEEALELCQTHTFDMVISDWMMPGMSGVEFCSAFRALDRDSYGYFILLTSKSAKAEVAHGLDGGADDFLVKPVSTNELLARIRAGDRILRMERELTQKNRLVSDTLDEMRGLYAALDKDLGEARKLQQSLVRERFRDFGRARLSLLLRPSGHVGGDLVGFFPVNEKQLGFYAIDVAGHGVASALMTARLAAYLSGNSPRQNLAFRRESWGEIVARPPARVAQALNEVILTEMDTDHYFTMVLGYLNLATGGVVLTQCGHPHPLIQRQGGRFEQLGTGGFPIGLLPDAEFEEVTTQLGPGDRLLVCSDGFTECVDQGGNMLSDGGLVRMLRRHHDQTGTAFFDAMVGDLGEFASGVEFPDDISGVLVEYG